MRRIASAMINWSSISRTLTLNSVRAGSCWGRLAENSGIAFFSDVRGGLIPIVEFDAQAVAQAGASPVQWQDLLCCIELGCRARHAIHGAAGLVLRNGRLAGTAHGQQAIATIAAHAS